MARRMLLAVVLCAASAGTASAAPAPRTADRWEYGEIHYISAGFRGRDADDVLPGRGPRRGTPRGGFPGGGDTPAQPDQAAQLDRPRVTVRWISAEGEVEASSWEELAAKLKVPAERVAPASPA